MQIRDHRKSFSSALEEKYGRGEAAAITRIIFEDLLRIDHGDFSSRESDLSASQQLMLLNALERLLNDEPVQYITGKARFLNIDFVVNGSVLIPRPETEELARLAIDRLQTKKDARVIDIGTGSGCIAIALKKNCPDVTVDALDKSRTALNVAAKNAVASSAKINFIESDFLKRENRSALAKYDLIISNPPYIPQQEIEAMPLNVSAWEPKQALFVPDNDPLIFYRAIAHFAQAHLAAHGAVMLELHENYARETAAIFSNTVFQTEIKKDISGKDRMLIVTPYP